MDRRETTTPPAGPTDAPTMAGGLAKLSLVLRHHAVARGGDTGLSPTQGQVLAVLAARGAMAVSKLAVELAITTATVSDAISTLVAKRLVKKSRPPGDGRVVLVALSAAGRRAAAGAAQWPDVLLGAVDALEPAERAAFTRTLVKMVRHLQEAGAIPVARMCTSCVHFGPDAYPGADRPHHCRFVNAAFGDAELRFDCREQSPVDPPAGEQLWQLFIRGRPQTGTVPLSPAAQWFRKETVMKTATFYHAGCPVCVAAEHQIAESLDPTRFKVEIVHLGQTKGRIAEAERAGVASVPALVLDGTPFHINFGASLADLKA